MNNCTIYPIDQGSPEWHEVRARCFTASELAPFFLESRTATQKAARRKLIMQKVREDLHRRGIHYEEWEREAMDKEERAMQFNIAVQRGKALEPMARQEYSDMTGTVIKMVGFIMHEYGGFGCSPDGLAVGSIVSTEDPSHGLEIKCVMPEKHLAMMLDPQALADEYAYQIHGSMAVTGLDRWDLFGYCPNYPPVFVKVERSEFTERLLAGIKSMVDEKEETMEQLKKIWGAWKP